MQDCNFIPARAFEKSPIMVAQNPDRAVAHRPAKLASPTLNHQQPDGSGLDLSYSETLFYLLYLISIKQVLLHHPGQTRLDVSED